MANSSADFPKNADSPKDLGSPNPEIVQLSLPPLTQISNKSEEATMPPGRLETPKQQSITLFTKQKPFSVPSLDCIEEKKEEEKKQTVPITINPKPNSLDRISQFASKRLDTIAVKVVPDAPFFRKASIALGAISGFFVGSNIASQIHASSIAKYTVGGVTSLITANFAAKGIGEYINCQTIHAVTLENQIKKIKEMNKRAQALNQTIDKTKRMISKMDGENKVILEEVEQKLEVIPRDYSPAALKSPDHTKRIVNSPSSNTGTGFSVSPPVQDDKRGVAVFQYINTVGSAISGYFVGHNSAAAFFTKVGVGSKIVVPISYGIGGVSCIFLAYLAYKGIHEYIHSQEIHQQKIQDNQKEISHLEQKLSELQSRVRTQNERIEKLQQNNFIIQRNLSVCERVNQPNQNSHSPRVIPLAWQERKSERLSLSLASPKLDSPVDNHSSNWKNAMTKLAKACGAPFFPTLSTFQSGASGYSLGYNVLNNLLFTLPAKTAQYASYGAGGLLSLINAYYTWKGINEYKQYQQHYKEILEAQNKRIVLCNTSITELTGIIKHQREQLRKLQLPNTSVLGIFNNVSPSPINGIPEASSPFEIENISNDEVGMKDDEGINHSTDKTGLYFSQSGRKLGGGNL